MAETRSVVTATIPSGSNVSNAIDCNDRSVIGFVAPAAWTAATLAIEVSIDGTNWITAILDTTSTALCTYSAVTAGAGYPVDVFGLLPWQFIRFKSGANQAAARSFSVISRPL